MKTFIVKFNRTNTVIVDGNPQMITEVASEEVEAAAYVPLPQKVANFYEKPGVGEAQPPRGLVASFYDVVSVTVKK